MSRTRILVVVTKSPERGPRLASSEAPGLPPRGAVHMAAELLRLGAEVRVLDQDGEDIASRVVRRETKWWRADVALLWAGGSRVAANPVPDTRPLIDLMSGWSEDGHAVVCGPLADLYAEELVQKLPTLTGALRGRIDSAMAGPFDPDGVPGLVRMGADGPVMPLPPTEHLPRAWPAWHLVLGDAHRDHPPEQLRPVGLVCGQLDAATSLDQVRHAVHRAGARHIVFEDRDFGKDPERTRGLARGMFGAAPGVTWSCRVRADHVTTMLALHLFQGGCKEVLITSPTGIDAAGQAPMDDPARPAVETAVDAIRVTGMSPVVEHIIGRPGHDLDILAAWQRWYYDRRIAVRPHVRLIHAGAQGPELPTIDEARERAGCWDNDLRPKDVERAVRTLLKRPREPSVHP